MKINSFLHPNLQNPENPQYRIARVLVAGLVIISLFLIPYTIYFLIAYPEDTIKNITNLSAIPFFLISFLLIRKSKNLFWIVLLINFTSSFLTYTSVLSTGGIYSVDVSWFLLALVTSYIFAGKKAGTISLIYLSCWISYLYYLESKAEGKINIYKSYIINHDSTHYLFTWIFIFIIISVLLYAFLNILDNTNKKLDDMSKSRIDNLQIELKFKIDEISSLRSQLARDFHDEMGNNLTAISILAQSVALKSKQKADNSEIEPMLTSIEKKSIELYNGTKDFIWSIDFKSDYVSELYIYIRDFGENFFSNIDIDFLSENNINSELLLKPNVGRQILFMCKEIMNNAAKHSKATQIHFQFNSIDNQSFKCTIQDNGTGFDRNIVSERGIKNIVNRAEKCNIKIELDSNSMGTKYVLIIPTYKLMPTQNG